LQETEELAPEALVRIGKAIAHARAVAAVEHEPRVLEICEVAGDVRLWRREHVLEVTNAEFTVQ
jgi:hypothetical protein